ncbi:DUF1990 family protein [Pseudonocardia petroleophila]|uniref:DUF1990 family protein n=1 Tax=Pseudonocardia petroleophila TaxID=37331 RepID=UPI0021063EBD|nr:DUF1990 family protein [Pseudonocardia petroleophila]
MSGVPTPGTRYASTRRIPSGQRTRWSRRSRGTIGRVPVRRDPYRSPALNAPDLAAIVDDLGGRSVNYDEALAPPHVTDGWHQDRWTVELGHEAPGEPEPDGLVAAADALVNGYEFTDPSLLRAVYRYPADVVGRDMLLQGRFAMFRFHMGVRITAELDELREGPDGPERVVGWAYQTLDGHLEQGRLTYEIAKDLTTGRVEFRIDAYSRQSQIRNPLFRVGFGFFGRHTQLRFYRAALERLKDRLPHPPGEPGPDADGLVRVPTGAPPDRAGWAEIHVVHPGR